MRYTLEFTASAAREFRALDRQTQRRISTKVSELAEDPFPAAVRKFQGEEDHWRIEWATTASFIAWRSAEW
jgi:mRNA-degrading endonuclease RelE of RelBE toxin-antitoxin system